MERLGLLLALALLTYVPGIRAADIKTSISPFCAVDISGEIDSSTPRGFERAIRSLRTNGCSGPVMVYLNSGGGDIQAALRTGQLARDNDVVNSVLEGSQCASACVLLLVGGATRIVLGRIGLHRPFSVDRSVSIAESQRRYDQLNSQIQAYLRAMNVPAALLTAMNTVSPGSIRWISYDEVERLYISGIDPAVEDHLDSERAKSLGISKQELYGRRQRADVACPFPSSILPKEPVLNAMRCREEIIKGER